MITRLYVDNFRCLVNFEYKPGALQLILGGNGTGKSTALEVLERLRELTSWGAATEQMFPSASLTAWQSRPEQTFELDLSGNDGVYTYRLAIVHDVVEGTNRIREETLRFDGHQLYRFDGDNIHLLMDNLSPGPVYPHDPRRSGLALIPERRDNQKLTWFRRRIDRVYFLAIDPFRMENASLREDPAPSLNLHNLASWYRHLAQDAPETIGPLFASLGEVIDGFTGLKLTSAGEMARLLRIGFRKPEDAKGAQGDFFLPLSDLSPGQRCLVALFTIVHCAIRPDVTICIDEPDNFIALREIQPWATQLQEQVERQNSQCLLISHHPELIDLLAVRHGVRFARTGTGPVRVGSLDSPNVDGIRPSEIVARGWEE